MNGPRVTRQLGKAELAMLTYPCGYCGATPDTWCTTSTGNWSTHLHSDRWYQWRRAEVEAQAASEVQPHG